MRTSLDIEAETPLLEKRAFSEVEVDPPSLETAFPVGKTPYVHAVRPVLTLFSLVDIGAEGQRWKTLSPNDRASRVQGKIS